MQAIGLYRTLLSRADGDAAAACGCSAIYCLHFRSFCDNVDYCWMLVFVVFPKSIRLKIEYLCALFHLHAQFSNNKIRYERSIAWLYWSNGWVYCSHVSCCSVFAVWFNGNANQNENKTKKKTTKKQYVEEKNETLIKVHPPKRAYSLHTQSGKAKNTAQTHTLTKINK